MRRMLEMEKIKVVIVDDISDIKDYFKMIIDREGDMEVVGTASSGKEAFEVAKKMLPDIMLIDIQMETEFAGIDAIKKIKEKMPDVKMIVLTVHEEDEILFRAYAAGAIDFITKNSSLANILNSIRSVHNNNLSMRPDVAEKLLNEFSRLRNEQGSMIYTLNTISKLTASEFDIIKAIYHGSTYKEISHQRFVEAVTVRTQVNKILKKFNMSSMKEIIDALKKLKIFDIYE
jgi:DNA-binding NarL/FixJ family response regulator